MKSISGMRASKVLRAAGARGATALIVVLTTCLSERARAAMAHEQQDPPGAYGRRYETVVSRGAKAIVIRPDIAVDALLGCAGVLANWACQRRLEFLGRVREGDGDMLALSSDERKVRLKEAFVEVWGGGSRCDALEAAICAGMLKGDAYIGAFDRQGILRLDKATTILWRGEAHDFGAAYQPNESLQDAESLLRPADAVMTPGAAVIELLIAAYGDEGGDRPSRGLQRKSMLECVRHWADVQPPQWPVRGHPVSFRGVSLLVMGDVKQWNACHQACQRLIVMEKLLAAEDGYNERTGAGFMAFRWRRAIGLWLNEVAVIVPQISELAGAGAVELRGDGSGPESLFYAPVGLLDLVGAGSAQLVAANASHGGMEFVGWGLRCNSPAEIAPR